VLLKSSDPEAPLTAILSRLRAFAAAESRPKVSIDVDPASML
jgi:hypothetical protein